MRLTALLSAPHWLAPYRIHICGTPREPRALPEWHRGMAHSLLPDRHGYSQGPMHPPQLVDFLKDDPQKLGNQTPAQGLDRRWLRGGTIRLSRDIKVPL